MYRQGLAKVVMTGKNGGSDAQAPGFAEIKVDGKNPEEGIRQTRILALMTSLDGTHESFEFTAGTVRHVDRMLRDTGIPREQFDLDVLLSGPGGNPHQAYKLAKVLHHHASKIRFFVMDYAKSAATLLALSGHEIRMGPRAELGPLDMQMEHKNLEGMGPMSALEAVQPINYFIDLASEVAFDIGRTIRNEVQLSRHDALELALGHSQALLAPVFSKFEPSAVSQAERQLEVGAKYAAELLRRYHFGGEQTKAGMVDAIARHLVWGFPDHGYVIWRDEVAELGLNVKPAEEDEAWFVMRAAYRHLGGFRGCRPELLEPSAFADAAATGFKENDD